MFSISNKTKLYFVKKGEYYDIFVLRNSWIR